MSTATVNTVYIAGFGCRRDCSEASLRLLLESTLQQHGLDIALLNGIASIDSKRDEAGLIALATTLHLPLHLLSAAQLTKYENRLTQRSEKVLATTGVAGIAEAAALAQAEIILAQLAKPGMAAAQRAELIIEKCSNGAATFALARIVVSPAVTAQSTATINDNTATISKNIATTDKS